IRAAPRPMRCAIWWRASSPSGASSPRKPISASSRHDANGFGDAVVHITRMKSHMDLGIAGRKAIVCASSRGLGRACAQALAAAGCDVVINGLDAARLEETAAELRKATGAKVTPVRGDVASAEGQAALFAACSEPDILINNNAAPPPRDFRELTRQQMLDGVIANMVVAIELTQKAIGSMTAKRF